uniref:Ribonuclease H-like domain-containing protein n=1 Tax=Tanacetum cinerariifolium TaxID=118510 RepID=A0A6L2LUS5_TANCI|nr:ribonuclease H-like domain-containing protein [Tanacetum cinerariifolium]
MTGNKCYLTDYKDYDGGFVFFGDGKGRISGKGKIKTRTLDFDDVYFCKELKYNQFSVSQMPGVTGFQSNGIAGTKDNIVADESQISDNGGQNHQVTRNEFEGILQQERQTEHINNANSFNTVSSTVNTVGPSFVNATSPLPINVVGTPASTNAFEEHPFE